jgi:hypothetical protein
VRELRALGALDTVLQYQQQAQAGAASAHLPGTARAGGFRSEGEVDRDANAAAGAAGSEGTADSGGGHSSSPTAVLERLRQLRDVRRSALLDTLERGRRQRRQQQHQPQTESAQRGFRSLTPPGQRAGPSAASARKTFSSPTTPLRAARSSSRSRSSQAPQLVSSGPVVQPLPVQTSRAPAAQGAADVPPPPPPPPAQRSQLHRQQQPAAQAPASGVASLATAAAGAAEPAPAAAAGSISAQPTPTPAQARAPRLELAPEPPVHIAAQPRRGAGAGPAETSDSPAATASTAPGSAAVGSPAQAAPAEAPAPVASGARAPHIPARFAARGRSASAPRTRTLLPGQPRGAPWQAEEPADGQTAGQQPYSERGADSVNPRQGSEAPWRTAGPSAGAGDDGSVVSLSAPGGSVSVGLPDDASPRAGPPSVIGAGTARGAAAPAPHRGAAGSGRPGAGAGAAASAVWDGVSAFSVDSLMPPFAVQQPQRAQQPLPPGTAQPWRSHELHPLPGLPEGEEAAGTRSSAASAAGSAPAAAAATAAPAGDGRWPAASEGLREATVASLAASYSLLASALHLPPAAALSETAPAAPGPAQAGGRAAAAPTLPSAFIPLTAFMPPYAPPRSVEEALDAELGRTRAGHAVAAASAGPGAAAAATPRGGSDTAPPRSVAAPLPPLPPRPPIGFPLPQQAWEPPSAPAAPDAGASRGRASAGPSLRASDVGTGAAGASLPDGEAAFAGLPAGHGSAGNALPTHSPSAPYGEAEVLRLMRLMSLLQQQEAAAQPVRRNGTDGGQGLPHARGPQSIGGKAGLAASGQLPQSQQFPSPFAASGPAAASAPWSMPSGSQPPSSLTHRPMPSAHPLHLASYAPLQHQQQYAPPSAGLQPLGAVYSTLPPGHPLAQMQQFDTQEAPAAAGYRAPMHHPSGASAAPATQSGLPLDARAARLIAAAPSFHAIPMDVPPEALPYASLQPSLRGADLIGSPFTQHGWAAAPSPRQPPASPFSHSRVPSGGLTSGSGGGFTGAQVPAASPALRHLEAALTSHAESRVPMPFRSAAREIAELQDIHEQLEAAAAGAQSVRRPQPGWPREDSRGRVPGDHTAGQLDRHYGRSSAAQGASLPSHGSGASGRDGLFERSRDAFPAAAAAAGAASLGARRDRSTSAQRSSGGGGQRVVADAAPQLNPERVAQQAMRALEMARRARESAVAGATRASGAGNTAPRVEGSEKGEATDLRHSRRGDDRSPGRADAYRGLGGRWQQVQRRGPSPQGRAVAPPPPSFAGPTGARLDGVALASGATEPLQSASAYASPDATVSGEEGGELDASGGAEDYVDFSGPRSA